MGEPMVPEPPPSALRPGLAMLASRPAKPASGRGGLLGRTAHVQPLRRLLRQRLERADVGLRAARDGSVVEREPERDAEREEQRRAEGDERDAWPGSTSRAGAPREPRHGL